MREFEAEQLCQSPWQPSRQRDTLHASMKRNRSRLHRQLSQRPGSSGDPRTQKSTSTPSRFSVGWGIVAVSAVVLALVIWVTRESPPKALPTAVAATNAAAQAQTPPALLSLSTNQSSPPPGLSLTQPGPPSENTLVEKVNLANKLLEQGKPADAERVLKEAARLNPNDEDVHYNLGIALARQGKSDEALLQYEEALRLLPDYAEVHNNIGNLLLRMGRRDEAIRHFEQAVKITPDSAASWNNFGNALQQIGRTNEAFEYFQKAANLDTNYWQAHLNLATSYLQQKRYPDARLEFETVQRLNPSFERTLKATLARIAEMESTNR